MKRQIVLALALLAFVAALILPSRVQAQTAATSAIVGTVTDPSNAAIPGARILLKNVATGVSLATTANGSGQYTFPTITPGTYTLAVTKAGFKNATVQHLVVNIARSYTVNVTMQVGAVSESVTVEAGANVQLQTTTAQVGGVVNHDEMSHLPTLNHQATELIMIQPSVSPGTRNALTPQPRFSGAIDDQNTFTLDGVDISDNELGDGTWIPVNIDSVQELDTGVTNPNATFGRSSGGQINLLGRHGTNEYHGSVYWYLQNSAFNANSWDLNSVAVERPNLVDNRGGVRFGGPIFKNKTFIFANYELDRFPQSATFTRLIPTPSLAAGILTFKDASGNPITYNLATSMQCGPAGNAPCDPRHLGISPTVQDFWKLMPAVGNDGGVGDGLNYTGFRSTVSTPQDTDFGVLRLDHNFTDKWRFSGSYSYWRDIASGGQISILNGTPSDPSTSPIRTAMVTGQLTTLISPTLTNTFRFGWVRNWQNFQVESPAVSAAKLNLPGTASGVASDPFVAINPAEALLGAPIDNTSNNARFQDYFQRSIQFNDGFDWIKGKHIFEFGTDDRRLPLLTDRADKVVNGITSLVTVMGDAASGSGSFLLLPSSDAPPTCAPGGPTNCILPSEVSQWNELYAGALGLIDNTSILSVRNGSLQPLPFGTPLSNNTVQDQFYFYGQDNWRLTNSLTLNYGLAYGWQTPPTDTLGRQTVLINDATGQELSAPAYLQDKMSAALQGQIFNPTTAYVPVNLAHKPVFNTDWGDVAPRVSVAWNPSFTSGFLGRMLGDRRAVIRSGYSLVYDRETTIETVVIPMLGVGFGQTISSILPPCAVGSQNCASSTNPALSDFRVGVDGQIPIPTVPSISSPVVPSTPFGELLSFQDDPDFKVGRAQSVDFDVQRELPHNMLLEVGYIGHFGSRLPSSVDLDNSPYFFKDTASGQTFAQAFDAVSASLQAGQSPAPQAFFENQLPGFAAATCGVSETNTACLASLAKGTLFTDGETATLFQKMDLYRLRTGMQSYDNLQTLLSELRTYIGTSSYNAFIVSVTKKTSAGLTLQANYTLSKALDQGLLVQNNAGYYLNSFDINANYGPSRYDRRNLITGDFVYDLPIGTGHRFHFNNGFDRALSGWYWSGIFEAYSGLPNTVTESSQVWGVSSVIGTGVPAIPTVPSSQLKNSVNSGVIGSGGIGTATNPASGGTGLNIFGNPAAAFADFRDVKLSTDGRDGGANPFYGLGMWNFDMSVGKSTRIREKMTMDFSAQFLNVFNNVNFQTPGLSLTSPANFGEITSTFVPENRTNSARWIELGLRLSF